MIRFPDTTLFLDIESHSITERLDHAPRDYFRLGGFAWGESNKVRITDSYDETIAAIRKAKVVVGHNVHMFDLFDTLTHATLVNPAPYSFVNANGKTQLSNEPSKARAWFSLNNQAYQLGVPGKLLDLSAMAAEYEYEEWDEPTYSAKTGKLLKRVIHHKVRRSDVCCGYGHIPTDRPDFREYLRDDVLASRHVARELLKLGPLNEYAWRAQKSQAIDAQIHRNGVVINRPLVDESIVAQDTEAAYALNDLHDRFKFPVQGKKPLATNEGKSALVLALKSVGVKTRDLARTDKGALSFGADSVRKACGLVERDGVWVEPEGIDPDKAKLARTVALLAGQRTLAQLVKRSMYRDGKVHPEILPLQKSGRKSITNPGMTVFNNEHKIYFDPDSPDHVMMEFDLSNADARGVASMSGDRAYAVRFEPGQDGHMLNAIAAWGRDAVMESDATKKRYRQKAKVPGHGWSYRGGPKTLAAQTGSTFEEMKVFCDGMNKAFRIVVKWQDDTVAFGRKHGYVINAWGRKMPLDMDRVYTQAPALLGQSWTTELITDALMKLPLRILKMVKITIHDAILFSIPKATLDEDRATIVKCMTSVHHPAGGQRIEFPVSYGPPGRNWAEAVH
jgi:DNA polymerase-1